MRRTVAASALGAGLALAVLGQAGGDKAARAQEGEDALIAQGVEVFGFWCAPCHAPGPGHPGTQSLQVKYGGEIPAVLEERTDLTPAAVEVFVRQGVLSMAPFRKTEVSDADLAAIGAYLSQNNPDL